MTTRATTFRMTSGEILAAGILFLALTATLCEGGQAARLARLPVVVQRTIQAQVGPGELLGIERATEDGAVVFEVEMSLNGRTRTFTVGAMGELIDLEVFLDETSPAVQKTIATITEGGKLNSINRTSDGGKPIYDVEMIKEGRTRSFTVNMEGELVNQELFLDETPPAVKQTIEAQVGKGKLLEIDRATDEGDPVYQVEMAKEGNIRHFTVATGGDLLNMQLFLEETPPSVQKIIQTQVGTGRLVEIDKTTSDGDVVYEVEIVRDGKTRDFTVGAEGEMIEMELFLEETPEAVAKAIQEQSTSQSLAAIYRKFEDGKVVYEVEITKSGKSCYLNLDPAGALLYKEETVALAELPAEVQKTVQALLGEETLSTLTKTTEGKEISYFAEMKRAGKKRSFSLDANGKVLSSDKD